MYKTLVYPDGTICISQSTLNLLDSIDEIAAIIAHEIIHLQNKTFETKQQASYLETLGVGWLHEMVSDQQSVDLLSESGYQSTAFSTAIVKIAAIRGFIHQSGMARASHNIARHALIDSRTSQQDYQPKPSLLEGNISPTNLTIAKKACSHKDISLLQELLPQLHPRDLRTFDQTIIPMYQSSLKFSYQVIQIYNELVGTRLEHKGFSSEEIAFALIARKSRNPALNASLLNDNDHLMAVIWDIPSIMAASRLWKMRQATRGALDVQSHEAVDNFFRAIIDHISWRKNPDSTDLVQSDDQLLELLELTSARFTDIEQGDLIRYRPMTNHNSRIIAAFVKSHYVKERDGELVINLKKARQLMKRIKQSDIELDINTIKLDMFFDKESRRAYDQMIDDVFEIEEYKMITPEELIQQLYDNFRFSDESSSYLNSGFYQWWTSLLEDTSLDTTQRARYMKEISDWVQTLPFDSPYSLLEVLDGRFNPDNLDYTVIPSAVLSPEETKLNTKIARFMLEVNLAFSIFKDDGDEFYQFLEEAISRASVEWATLSETQLINSALPLLTSDSRTSVYLDESRIRRCVQTKKVKIKDFQRLASLKPIRALLERDSTVECDTIGDLRTHIETKLANIIPPERAHQMELYSDEIFHLSVWRGERESFGQLLDDDFDVLQAQHYIDFLDQSTREDTPITRIRRRIALKFLDHPQPTFETKLKFLQHNFNLIGIEGIHLLGSQITDIQTYETFREQIGRKKLQETLKGTEALSALAAADFVSSIFMQNKMDIIATCVDDPEAIRKNTTDFVVSWFKNIFQISLAIESPVSIFDEDTGKIQVNRIGRSTLRTPYEMIDYLQSLTYSQKLAIAHKLLTEQYGLLSSEETKEEFTDFVLQSLEMTDPDALPAVMLRASIRTGDPKLISFPLAQLIAPLLFRGLDLETIDMQTIAQLKLTSRDSRGEKRTVSDLLGDRIESVIRSTSRELAEFGSIYAHQPDSPLVSLAHESDDHYHYMLDHLEAITQKPSFEDPAAAKPAITEEALDANTEAIIQALEGGGATIVRQMQLSTQFYRLEPPLHRRLTQTLDSNPGLSRLAAWENLSRWSTKDQELRDYLERITILEKVGGGSLKTVFAAREQDTGVDVVLRIENPNSTFFIREGHSLADGIYDEVEQETNGRYRREAKIGRMLNDIARQWCLRDLSDTRFNQDDPRFRDQIRELSDKLDAQLRMPEIRLDTGKVMSVIRSPGTTANQLINSDAPSELKEQIVRTITRLNRAQTEYDTRKIIDPDGSEYIIVHSDQHLGNFMVYIDPEHNLVVDIIDTDMYLRLREADVEILDKLVIPGNNKKFVDTFIDRIMDLNHLRGMSRKTSKSRILRTLAPEYARQKLRGETDKLLLLQTIFEACAQQELDIPLRIQLMIRNAGANMKLRSEYNLN